MSEGSGILEKLDPHLLALARELGRLFDAEGGQLSMVGGSVRDLFLGSGPDELDLEVRGLPLEKVMAIVQRKYSCDEVGKAFGVLRIHGKPVEIALPRKECKSGTGHKGFEVEIEPFLPFELASARRDFTINAMGLNPISGELMDPFNGMRDLQKHILRHVGPAFIEDPLRVLRGMQFVARFDLSAAPETITLCQSMEMEGLPAERLYEEWKKLILRGKNITAGLNFLKDAGWLKYFEELKALVGCKQEPEWHPEGDVWIHTLHCMDAFARERTGEKWEDLVVGFAVLCHDFGKPATTYLAEDGRIRSPLHEPRGEEPTRSFLSRLTNQVDLHEEVVPLVRRHLTPRVFFKDQAGDGAIRRLARKVKRIDRLVRVAAADISGRPPRKDDFPEGPWLLKRAKELKVSDSEPEPIILGRHLIDRGMNPSPKFGPILEECFEAQLDGKFIELKDGLDFLSQILRKENS
tara:strand:- start:56 stop:1450 length:1395 start_codon:yes stop_codon:yes gene_type:complete